MSNYINIVDFNKVHFLFTIISHKYYKILCLFLSKIVDSEYFCDIIYMWGVGAAESSLKNYKFRDVLAIIIFMEVIIIMSSGIPVQAVCNTILLKGFTEKISITPMKLQKLLYFTHREYLRQNDGQPLFSEQFEAWPYGPVLSSVYDEFKSFHSEPITKFAKNADGSVTVVSERNAEDVMNALNKVWRTYKDFTGIQLSEITHKEGSAWRKAMDEKRTFLKDEDIQGESVGE